jgi:hypothetical protein
VLIRIKNVSDVELKNVIVQFPTQKEDYGNIHPGNTTGYRKVDKAYGYAHIQSEIEGMEAVIQPEDYMGEKLLPTGKYTYTLTYNPNSVDKFSNLDMKLTRE